MNYLFMMTYYVIKYINSRLRIFVLCLLFNIIIITNIMTFISIYNIFNITFSSCYPNPNNIHILSTIHETMKVLYRKFLVLQKNVSR